MPAGWRFPLTVKAVFLDLDGTIMASYKTLLAAQFIEEHVKFRSDQAPGFVERYYAPRGIQALLHDPAEARHLAIEYARENHTDIAPDLMRMIRGLQAQSFFLYDGFRDLLDRLRRQGTFVGIYTNTPYDRAIHRLRHGLLDPHGVDTLWAKNIASPDDLMLREYADVLIPYDYCKPDDTPLRDVMRLTGLEMPEVLFVGDGLNDLDVAYRDPTRPAAIFCFHEQGAADICAKTAQVSARLRPHHTPLGLDAVNRRIEQYGIGGEVIRLRRGFPDLLKLIDHGRIALAAPDRKVAVRNGRLVPALSRAASLGRAGTSIANAKHATVQRAPIERSCREARS